MKITRISQNGLTSTLLLMNGVTPIRGTFNTLAYFTVIETCGLNVACNGVGGRIEIEAI